MRKIITEEEIKKLPKSIGKWVFEMSNNFYGHRCQNCRVWIYDGAPQFCECDKRHREKLAKKG